MSSPTMDPRDLADIVAENLAKELISGEQLTQCCKIATLVDKLLKQRERTIANLTRAAESLNKHLQKSAIAKTVGASVAAGGKAVTATGAGAMVVTAGTGFIAATGLAVVGGVTTALGSTVIHSNIRSGAMAMQRRHYRGQQCY